MPPTFKCSYLGCEEAGEITSVTGRIEICTVMPSKINRSTRKSFIMNWRDTGDAVLHPSCWEYLLKTAKSKKLSKGVMIDQERSLIKEAAKTCERHDSAQSVMTEARRVADMIRSAKYCVAFTGAGISTSAGIGDYRGKNGKWTEEDRKGVKMEEEEQEEDNTTIKGKRMSKKIEKQNKGKITEPTKRKISDRSEMLNEDETVKKQKLLEDNEMEAGKEEDDEGVPYEKLRPTYTHEAMKKLMDMGLLKHIISQNGDGLHGLSGIPDAKLSELHGNVFREKCEKCGSSYERSYYVMDDVASEYYEELEDHGKTSIIKPKHAKKCDLCGLSHRTGRRCTKKGCKGFLIDTIINFRDNLEESILDRGWEESEKNDLMLCLGTTLQVTPANEMVEMGKHPLRLVICNRQKTDLDDVCDKTDSTTKKAIGSRVFGDCDVLMKGVMSHILSEEELREWESLRQDRMKEYDTQRD